MKKSKFLFMTGISMVALIIFLIAYIIILGDAMDLGGIAVGLSLACFGLGVSIISAILNFIKIEE